MRTGAHQGQFCRPGSEIQDRHVKAAIVDVNEPDRTHDSQVSVGHRRTPGIHERRAVVQAPDQWDVCVTRYSDVDSAPETAFKCRPDIVVGPVFRVSQVVGEADLKSLYLRAVEIEDSRIFRNARAADAWPVGVTIAAARRQWGQSDRVG